MQLSDAQPQQASASGARVVCLGPDTKDLIRELFTINGLSKADVLQRSRIEPRTFGKIDDPSPREARVYPSTIGKIAALVGVSPTALLSPATSDLTVDSLLGLLLARQAASSPYLFRLALKPLAALKHIQPHERQQIGHMLLGSGTALETTGNHIEAYWPFLGGAKLALAALDLELSLYFCIRALHTLQPLARNIWIREVVSLVGRILESADRMPAWLCTALHTELGTLLYNAGYRQEAVAFFNAACELMKGDARSDVEFWISKYEPFFFQMYSRARLALIEGFSNFQRGATNLRGIIQEYECRNDLRCAANAMFYLLMIMNHHEPRRLCELLDHVRMEGPRCWHGSIWTRLAARGVEAIYLVKMKRNAEAEPLLKQIVPELARLQICPPKPPGTERWEIVRPDLVVDRNHTDWSNMPRLSVRTECALTLSEATACGKLAASRAKR